MNLHKIFSLRCLSRIPVFVLTFCFCVLLPAQQSKLILQKGSPWKTQKILVSPDNKIWASLNTSGNENTLQIRMCGNNWLLKEIKKVQDFAFSNSDGKLYFVDTCINFLNSSDVDSVSVLGFTANACRYPYSFSNLQIDPTGKFLLVTCHHNTLVYEMATWKLLFEINGAENDIKFSENSSLLCIAISDTAKPNGKIYPSLFSLPEGKRLYLSSFAMNDNSRFLNGATTNSSYYNTEKGLVELNFSTLKEKICDTATAHTYYYFDPAASFFIRKCRGTNSNDSLQSFDLTGKGLLCSDIVSKYLVLFNFHKISDKKLIFTAYTDDGFLLYYDIKNKKFLANAEKNAYFAGSFVTRDKKRMYISADGPVFVYNLDDGKKIDGIPEIRQFNLDAGNYSDGGSVSIDGYGIVNEFIPCENTSVNRQNENKNPSVKKRIRGENNSEILLTDSSIIFYPEPKKRFAVKPAFLNGKNILDQVEDIHYWNNDSSCITNCGKGNFFLYNLYNGKIKNFRLAADVKDMLPFKDGKYAAATGSDSCVYIVGIDTDVSVRLVGDYSYGHKKTDFAIDYDRNIILYKKGTWFPDQYLRDDGSANVNFTFQYFEKMDLSKNLVPEKLEIATGPEKVMMDMDGNQVVMRDSTKYARLLNNIYCFKFLKNSGNLALIRNNTGFREFIFEIWDFQNLKNIYQKKYTCNNGNIRFEETDNNSKILVIMKNDSLMVDVIDIYEGKSLYTHRSSNPDLFHYGLFSDKLLTDDYSGNTVITNIKTGKKVKVHVFNESEIMCVNDEGYYMTTSTKGNMVIFKMQNNYYSFEQFDLKYNRPDKVLESLGCNDTLKQNMFYKAYLKRLKKMNFTEDMLKEDFHLPELKIKNFESLPALTDAEKLNLEIELNDSKYKLDRLKVWINDVPVFGVAGIDLRKENALYAVKKIKFDLCEGQNKIQVSVLNQAGAESHKWTSYVTYQSKKEQKHDLYLVTIGDSKYKDSRYDLTYASKDALDIKNSFEKNSAEIYNKIICYTYTNEEVTRENIIKLKEKLKKAHRDDVVMITVAGHGVLDKNYNYYLATYNMDFNEPAKGGLLYEDLESLLDGIEPLKKILLLDACHSGEVDKEEVKQMTAANNNNTGEVKFRSAGPAIEKKNVGLKSTSGLMSELFSDLRRGTGATVISSAGGAEYAMESEEWKNGLFTYCLLHGLKDKAADLNGDGKIMLSELQRYLREEVLKLSNGQQQPTNRIQNISMDFRVW